MSHYKVMVRFGMDSAIPQDASVNTWHINTVSAPAGYEDFIEDLQTFYQAVDTWMSSALDPSKATYKVYDMLDDEPRAPVLEGAFTGLSFGAQAFPPELAICVSFQGTRLSGQPQARRRGRVYIGPISSVWASSSSPVIATEVVEDFASAAQSLAVAAEASTTYAWCVYSKADEDLVPVTNGWVDNAFDIQRRRGLTASVREAWTTLIP